MDNNIAESNVCTLAAGLYIVKDFRRIVNANEWPETTVYEVWSGSEYMLFTGEILWSNHTVARTVDLEQPVSLHDVPAGTLVIAIE